MNKLKRNTISESKVSAVKINSNGVTDYSLFNQLPSAVYCCDTEGNLTSFNSAAIKLWDNVPEVQTSKWCGSFKVYNVDGVLLQELALPMAKCVKSAKAIDGEEVIIENRSGEQKFVKVYPSPIFNEQGLLTGGICTLIEVTDQKKHDAKQAMLASIIESSNDAIISKTLQGVITSWNAGAQRIFGYTEAEVLGKRIEILIPPDRFNEEKQILAQLRKGNKVKHFETVRLTKDGKEIQISLTISPMKDKNGKIIGASKIARDITQQKKVEQDLIYHYGQLEILNAIGKVISEKLNVTEILQHVVDALTKITGAEFGICYYDTLTNCAESEVIFANTNCHVDGLKALTKANTAYFNPKHIKKSIIRLDNLNKDFNPEYGISVSSYLAVPIVSKSDKLLGSLFFGHNEVAKFTAAHEAIAINIASQTSVALDNATLFEEVKSLSLKKDQFIARASHEIKTPLTSIHGYLQLLGKEFVDGRSKLFLNKALNQLDKLNSLIAALFDLSKITSGKLTLDLKEVDLSVLINEIIDNYEVDANKTHQLILIKNLGSFVVKADKQRIEQVVLNLLNNAIKYSPNENKVIVELENNNTEILVHIQDYGMGISAEQQQQIFAQFYRADGVSANISGLGVGLHISKEIIECHNGRIWVNSELGEGARFSFALPVVN